jgi:hypothetical protein
VADPGIVDRVGSTINFGFHGRGDATINFGFQRGVPLSKYVFFSE